MAQISQSETLSRFLGGGSAPSTGPSSSGSGTHTIISPRDASGHYTSDLSETVGYVTLSQEEQAREIAYDLRHETNIPVGIVQTLNDHLGHITDRITHHNPPTAITNTTRITGDPTVQNRDILTGDSNKIIAIILATLVGIVLLFKLNKTK